MKKINTNNIQKEYDFFNQFQLNLYSEFGTMIDKLKVYPNFWTTCTLKGQRNFHSLYSHNYYIEYAKRFKNKRHTALKVLEIGVFQGFSIKLWEEYFTKADIYGIDINLGTKHNGVTPVELLKDKKRVHLFEFDATIKENIDKFVEENGGDFDIIIDDGSHYGEHQILFALLFKPLLKKDGIMVIEDVGLFYGADYEEYIFLEYKENDTKDIEFSNEKKWGMPMFEYFMQNYHKIKNDKEHKLNKMVKNLDVKVLDEFKQDWIEPINYHIDLNDVNLNNDNFTNELNGNSKMCFLTYKK